jgi:chromosome transmission fidelity protein 1
MRSVNQSVGRAIRHVGDYAAILFCDRRYAPSGADEPPRTRDCESEKKKELRGVPAQLAGWIGERLVTPSGYGQTQAGLARFFAGKRKK